ncbi:hypothetical protein FOXB_03415 [Fusarium oxysporum f. sp. conglutinans Fo5176]|uniref:Uncharacterized protein n=2 Tax=Fusarium oxysporum f. sp. conglutinans TaxID=100902 RepID=F9FAI9_FUSOF|nr:hypothetical protein FOXB_03415 [Fusarium oxysporum f. sp. conglutinans Fo5176]
MQIWHLLFTFAAAKVTIASPTGKATQGEADAAIIDAIIAKYNLTDNAMASPSEPKLSKRATKCYSDDWRWDEEYNYALDRAGRWCSGNGGAERKMFPHLGLLKNNEVDKAKLIKCTKLAWAAITTDQINALIDSLPRRLEACIRTRGQVKRGCYNLNDVKRVNFQIQNRRSRDIDLSSGLCFRFLSAIIHECNSGVENGNREWWWQTTFALAI